MELEFEIGEKVTGNGNIIWDIKRKGLVVGHLALQRDGYNVSLEKMTLQ